jgi:hypothetical protein
VILPLANWHDQQLGISAVASCICISTISCTTLLGMSKNRWPSTGASVFPTPYSPDLAIADFYLFGRSKEQLSGRTLGKQENMLETVTEILSERPKDEVKNALMHWKERCQWVADHNG